jgi:hypothetical protein
MKIAIAATFTLFLTAGTSWAHGDTTHRIGVTERFSQHQGPAQEGLRHQVFLKNNDAACHENCGSASFNDHLFT